ncbi:MAG: 4-hydroxy-tetrahydrodipicolinate reductase [Limnochordales bacterium]|nr:4-hydroxy-tetrahydrodipicolinate reductase [Limnochordales bacterium]
MIRVAVAGAAGRMGRETVKAILGAPDLKLVAAIGNRQGIGRDVGELAGVGPTGVILTADLKRALEESNAQVCVDFTTPQAGVTNARLILEQGVRPVLGTSGFSPADLANLDRLARELGLGGVVAANFALGAILMMQFAAQAARVFPDVEIVETHHKRKLDAPSGTARRTAELIAQARTESGNWAAAAAAMSTHESAGPTAPETEVPLAGQAARGLLCAGVPVHSLRVPGVVARQEVVFGSAGQTLRIIHESTDRTSFMPGVLFAIRKSLELYGLVSLEELLAAALRS